MAEGRRLAWLACLFVTVWLVATGRSSPVEERAAYTTQVRHNPADNTLLYGNPSVLKARAPQLSDADYAMVVSSVPILCVDVLLTRADGRALLVKRRMEPVMGLYWFP